MALSADPAQDQNRHFPRGIAEILARPRNPNIDAVAKFTPENQ